jgi:hypothetical protein
VETTVHQSASSFTRLFVVAAAFGAIAVPSAQAQAPAAPVAPVAAVAPVAKSTECTVNLKLCYCVANDFKPVIDEKVKFYRQQIADARAQGKAVAYMSLPLSTLGGGYFDVNTEVAKKTKDRIEARFGANAVWVLSPGTKDSDLVTPSGLRGSNDDYMLMWTRILEGVKGVGEDFDFVYFVGPSDFGAYFGFNGVADMEKVNAFYDERIKTDKGLQREVERGRVSKLTFRNYYGLKGSITVSNGAHEEWNIFRTLNERRRADKAYGIGNQIPMLFDGAAVAPATAEISNTPGISGACKLN